MVVSAVVVGANPPRGTPPGFAAAADGGALETAAVDEVDPGSSQWHWARRTRHLALVARS